MHSYLTPLTGLTAEIIDAHGVTLAEAVASVRAALPKHAVLVGQNIAKDVQWLGLIEGQDFQGMVDLAGVWRVWNPRFNTWSVFGQDHLVRVLLGAEFGAQHNAALDALKSVRLFNYWRRCDADKAGAGGAELERAKQALLNAPPEPSFAKKNPSFEGCCRRRAPRESRRSTRMGRAWTRTSTQSGWRSAPCPSVRNAPSRSPRRNCSRATARKVSWLSVPSAIARW